ncbi:cyclic lactone autoinducer peptide [Bacilli bacterium PM5-3]|nr:cyclic lactone autoinducer peptide [Bacilli bacterium PM5-3]MDH6603980.1 cyclic lactone autoinducer peptide [Bacilli bacterium PM5-9]
MRNNVEKKVLKTLKSISDSQVRNTIENRCHWWLYEPKMPKAVAKMKQEKNK